MVAILIQKAGRIFELWLTFISGKFVLNIKAVDQFFFGKSFRQLEFGSIILSKVRFIPLKLLFKIYISCPYQVFITDS